MIKTTCRLTITLALCALASTSYVLAVETNDTALTNSSPLPKIDSTNHIEYFWPRYSEAILNNQGLVLDRVGPQSDLNWTREIQKRRYGIHEKIISDSAHAIQILLTDSARDALMEQLPIDLWEEYASKLVVDSLGNPAEERIDLESSTYSAVEASWGQRALHDGRLQYGVRPWRTNPYFYATMKFGKWEDRPVLIVDGRVYYDVLNTFEKLQISFTFPMPLGLELTAGATLSPSRLASNERGSTPASFGWRLQKTGKQSGFSIGGRSNEIGARSDAQKETMIALIYFRPW